MDQDKAANNDFPRMLRFLAIQAVVVLAVAGTVFARLATAPARPALAPARVTPLAVKPTYDRPEIVSDADLRAVLHKLRPRFAGPRPMVNLVDHALRLWGSSAEFDDPECLSGRVMRDILLDHRVFAQRWGKDEPPLLIGDQHGVAIRTKEGRATSSHIDHTLACLAEAGTTLRFPVYLPQGQSSMGSLLARSVRSFSLNQGEYEWSMAAYALYVEGTTPWVTSEGQEVDFDRLAKRIMREELRCGVCFGQHRLGDLVLFLRVDEQQRILSPECREKILDYLGHVSKLLVHSQHPQGYWTQEWWTGKPPTKEDEKPMGVLTVELQRLLATGHVLEWLALAPQSLLPPPETLVKAGRWLTQTVLKFDDQEVIQDNNYPPLTHAGRGLALWRGRLPAEVLADKRLP